MTAKKLEEAYNEKITVFSPASWVGVLLESKI